MRGNLKDSPPPAAAAICCCAVKIAVWTGNQAGHGVRAIRAKKRSERCEHAVGCYPEHGAYAAGAAVASRSVKTCVCAQGQRAKRICTVRGQRGKGGQHSKAHPAERHFEKRAGAINAGRGGSVKSAVAGKY